MLDILLVQEKLILPPAELTKNIFNVGTNTQLPSWSVNLADGVTYESTPTIDGVTLAGSLGTADANITFATPVDLYTPNWTLEYSVIVTGPDTGQTIAEITLADTLSNLGPFYTRYSDSVHLNRFAVIGSNQTSGVYCTDQVRSNMSTLHRIALVKLGNDIYVYFNGVKKPLAVGSSTVYNSPAVPANASLLQSVKYICLGRSALTAFVGSVYSLKMGPVRFTGRALYTTNYTPVPF